MPGGCWPSANTSPSRRTESALVGRSWELNTITAILDEAIGGAGCVVTVVGPPGIGKSRLIREAAAIAADRGVEVFTTYCESHTRDIPFHAVARLLRAGMGINDLDAAQPGITYVTNSGTPIRKTSCSSRTCWVFATPRPHYPMSPQTRGGEG